MWLKGTLRVYIVPELKSRKRTEVWSVLSQPTVLLSTNLVTVELLGLEKSLAVSFVFFAHVVFTVRTVYVCLRRYSKIHQHQHQTEYRLQLPQTGE